jgi:hypothetical protein
MLIELANHNPDIRRLLERGYALRVDSAHLVIRDIPYLDSQLMLQRGAIVTKLEFVDNIRVRQQDHQIFFAGSEPFGLDGQKVPNLGGGPTSVSLEKSDVVVQRSFSNKPSVGFADFFEKIEHYVHLISGPAEARYGSSPLTFNIDADVVSDSPFNLQDTLTSRAQIGDLAKVFSNEVVALIGLGGTGSYLLDLLIKAPVRDVRAFDGDSYFVHNAFRSPGRLIAEELGKTKAEVYLDRYKNFRKNLSIQKKYVDATCADDLAGVTFAFVCVDKGSARREIFELLVRLKIPFIDVGMGLKRQADALAGALRVTYYSVEDAAAVIDMGLAEMVDDPNDIYRSNIQIAELNAMNACMALVRYKQIRGFYVDDNPNFHLLMGIESLHTFGVKHEETHS